MATKLEEQLANLKHGHHACPIFENTEEQMAVARGLPAALGRGAS
jgi:hypothetical protein